MQAPVEELLRTLSKNNHFILSETLRIYQMRQAMQGQFEFVNRARLGDQILGYLELLSSSLDHQDINETSERIRQFQAEIADIEFREQVTADS